MEIPQPVPVPTPTQNNFIIMNNGTVLYPRKKSEYLVTKNQSETPVDFKYDSFDSVIYPIACQTDGGILYSDSSTVYARENIISSNAPMKHQAQLSLDFVIGMGLVVIAVLALIYSLITYLFKKQ
jgi:hypothetical protein